MFGPGIALAAEHDAKALKEEQHQATLEQIQNLLASTGKEIAADTSKVQIIQYLSEALYAKRSADPSKYTSIWGYFGGCTRQEKLAALAHFSNTLEDANSPLSKQDLNILCDGTTGYLLSQAILFYYPKLHLPDAEDALIIKQFLSLEGRLIVEESYGTELRPIHN